jgi:hypothetical protein
MIENGTKHNMYLHHSQCLSVFLGYSCLHISCQSSFAHSLNLGLTSIRVIAAGKQEKESIIKQSLGHQHATNTHKFKDTKVGETKHVVWIMGRMYQANSKPLRLLT